METNNANDHTPENLQPNYENLLTEYLANPNADPVEFALHLVDAGATPNDYDNLIPKLEQETLPLAHLVKDYRVLLRGDTVESISQQKINFDRPRAMGMIRTWKMDLTGKNENLFIVGSIMDQIKDRYVIANTRYQRNMQIGSRELNPVIIYAFSNYPKTIDRSIGSGARVTGSLFVGDADDIGVTVDNNYFLKFPQEPQRDQLDRLLPYMVPGQNIDISDTHLNRHTNLIRQFQNPETHAVYTTLQHFTIIPKTYFNLELIAHRILTDLKTYSKENP